MSLPQEKLAELQAEYDWLGWKLDEHKKSASGDSEYFYNDRKEKQRDINRRAEIKKILNHEIPAPFVILSKAKNLINPPS
jgi:hypothetical protein